MNVLFMTLWILIFSLKALAAPREFLFHAGYRPHLEMDIQLGTVPEDVWTKSIFGQTNFDLPPHRQGLYGAEEVSGTSLYFLYQVLGSREPWIMTIHLNSACLNSSAVFHADYTVDLRETKNQNRFSKWYLKNRPRYRHLENRCLRDDEFEKSWEEGPLYSVGDSSEKVQTLTRLCSPVLNDFLNEEKIKIVFDMVNQDSWYIRDRSCLANITGTPDQAFDRLMTSRFGAPEKDVFEQLYADDVEGGVFHSGSTLYLLKILAETTRLNRAALPQLTKLLALAEKISGQQMIEHELSLDRNSDNLWIVRHALAATVRSIRSEKVDVFQSKLRLHLQSMIQSLGSACQGRHGVKPENRVACSHATEQETQTLLQSLNQI